MNLFPHVPVGLLLCPGVGRTRALCFMTLCICTEACLACACSVCIQVCSECARACAHVRVLGVHLHTCISVCASVPDPLCWQVYMKATLRGRQYTCVCVHLYFCVCDPSRLASAGRKTGRM